MVDQGYVFDRQGVHRIIAATRKSETTRESPTFIHRQPVDEGGSSGGPIVWARIIGDAICGGCYIGKLLTSPGTFDSSQATFSDSDVGTPGGDDILIVNRSERGLTTHILTEGTPQVHDVLCKRDDGNAICTETGFAVYHTGAFDMELGCTL